MRCRVRRSSSGFSLAELLVVVAIIGLLSLISVPAFMNFRRSSDFKAAMRTFTTDLRNARAAAIANSFDVRVEMQTGSPTTKNYYFYSSRDNGATWQPLTLSGTVIDPANPALPPHMKQFSGTVWVDSTTALPDYSMTNPTGPPFPTPNGMPDVVYHPNGAITLATGSTTGSIVLATDWKKIAYDRYTINLSPSGQFKAIGSHT